MTSDAPRPERCGAETRDGGYCENYPVDGAERCRMHGGTNDGAPARNQNARQSGVHADPGNVLNDLAENDPEAYEWILGKYDSYLADAPFSDGSAKADQLKQICAQEYVIWTATGFQIDSGVVIKTDEPDGDEFGDRVTENPVNLPLDRMQRTVTRRLKQLGILNDPDSQQAQAEAGKVGALRDMMGAVNEIDETEGSDG